MPTNDKSNIKEKIQTWRMAIVWFLIVLLCATFFFVGANYSCSSSGGFMLKLKCYNVNVIDVIEKDGNYFVAKNISGDTIEDLNKSMHNG